MSTPEPLRNSPLVDPATGFVTVTRETLQHTKYKNVFAIGDNCNTPNAKTAAAVGESAVRRVVLRGKALCLRFTFTLYFGFSGADGHATGESDGGHEWPGSRHKPGESLHTCIFVVPSFCCDVTTLFPAPLTLRHRILSLVGLF